MSDRVDTLVTLGSKGRRLTCRLVAIRTPPEVAQVRLERLEKTLKKKGEAERGPCRVLCQWTVLITNLLDTERFSMEQLGVLYRVRWQIELMFKRWKSGGGLGQSRKRLGGPGAVRVSGEAAGRADQALGNTAARRAAVRRGRDTSRACG